MWKSQINVRYNLHLESAQNIFWFWSHDRIMQVCGNVVIYTNAVSFKPNDKTFQILTILIVSNKTKHLFVFIVCVIYNEDGVLRKLKNGQYSYIINYLILLL